MKFQISHFQDNVSHLAAEVSFVKLPSDEYH